MDDQLRPAQPHAHEISLLAEVADIVRQAEAEFTANCPIAGRHETLRALNRLNAVLSGDAI